MPQFGLIAIYLSLPTAIDSRRECSDQISGRNSTGESRDAGSDGEGQMGTRAFGQTTFDSGAERAVTSAGLVGRCRVSAEEGKGGRGWVQ